MDYVEMLDVALSHKKTIMIASQQLKEANGVLLILKLMKKMLEGFIGYVLKFMMLRLLRRS